MIATKVGFQGEFQPHEGGTWGRGGRGELDKLKTTTRATLRCWMATAEGRFGSSLGFSTGEGLAVQPSMDQHPQSLWGNTGSINNHLGCWGKALCRQYLPVINVEGMIEDFTVNEIRLMGNRIFTWWQSITPTGYLLNAKERTYFSNGDIWWSLS